MLILYVLDVHEEAPQIRQKGRDLSDEKGKCLEREHRGMFPRGAIVTREE
jgi:hypothetical protein